MPKPMQSLAVIVQLCPSPCVIVKNVRSDKLQANVLWANSSEENKATPTIFEIEFFIILVY